MRKRAPRGMKQLTQRIASAKPVSSAVLLLQDVAPKKIMAKQSQHPQRAISEPSTWRLKPPSVKTLQPGE